MTLNEIDGCMLVVPSLSKSEFHEVFSLDGGSNDGTTEFLERCGIRVVRQVRRGYNAAYREALNFYSGDAIIFFHPKGTIDPGSLETMRNLLKQGNSLVIASRMLRSARNEEDDRFLRHRKWFGMGLAFVAAKRWGRSSRERITDPLHGYRGCSREFTNSLVLQPLGVTADLEMTRHAYISRLPFTEFPVQESERPVGTSHFPALSTGWQLLRYLLSVGSGKDS